MKRFLMGSLVVIVLLANLAGISRAAPETPGELDTTFAGFGNSGMVIIPAITPASRTGRPRIALQPDGKIVAADGTGPIPLVMRLHSNGTGDETFGGDGVITFPTTYPTRANDVAIQTDGKIVVAGRSEASHGSFMLARLTPTGEMDTSFGAGGQVYTDFDPNEDDGAEAVLIQPDGKIVAAGSAYDGDPDCGIARYNTDGSLDSTFSGDGKAIVAFGGDDECHDIAILEDGDLVIVGSYQDSLALDVDFAVARLNANGTPDTGFDSDGVTTTGFGDIEYAYAVAIQPDGKILVAGDSGENVCVARYLPDGVLDSTFDGDGKRSFSMDTTYWGGIYDMALQPDGRFLLLGFIIQSNGNDDFSFYRLNSDGSLDGTFGVNGALTIHINGQDYGYGLALQADGRIIAYGHSHNHDNPTFVRLWPDGSLDTGGQQVLDFEDPFFDPGSLENVTALAIQPDGNIVVAGDIGNASDSDRNFALARFLPDGLLDTSFGTFGRVSFGFGAKEVARAVVVQPDGKIVAAGTTGLDSAANVMVARFNPDGTPDGSFGFLGYRVVDFGGADDFGHALAMAPDGKIVVAGHNHKGFQRDSAMIVARFNSDGSPDNTFDLDGKFQRVIVSGVSNVAYAALVQPDLKIVLAGVAGGDFALLRVNEDGSLDESFGASGATITDLGNTDSIAGLARQENGSLVVAGSSTSATGSDFALARYTANGVLDTSFGTDGKVSVDFGGVDTAYAIDLRADGVIVAAGCSQDLFAVAQILPEGLLDPAFNGSGKSITIFVGSAECAYGVKFTAADQIIAAGSVSVNGNANMALARFETTPPLPMPPPSGRLSLYLPIIVR